jgi:citrate synthase
MINRRLSSAEAAQRLGVKPATLYSYVSRGLLHPERTNRGSLFDLNEVVQLSRSARNPGGPGHHAVRLVRGRPPVGDPVQEDPVFVTELTLIDGGRLYYRGADAVVLSRQRSFEEMARWLWTGDWGGVEPAWTVPDGTSGPVEQALAELSPDVSLLERFMVAVVAGARCDELRHDLNPAGVPVTGRSLLALLVASLPGPVSPPPGRPPGSISSRVWAGLAGPEPVSDDRAEAGMAAVDAALVLAADHELAPSTLAARVAASFRADPYAVVLTGLGPASGSWHAGSTGAPSEVESLLRQAAVVGPERAIGDRLRRGQDIPHGFGMPLYPDGDPRGAELLCRLDGVGPPARLDLVRRLIQVGDDRGFPPPNFDLGLGALSYCAGMRPGAGQAMFTIGKVAGWLAHAIEEYSSPTRFRSRADYVGAPPGVIPDP